MDHRSQSVTFSELVEGSVTDQRFVEEAHQRRFDWNWQQVCGGLPLIPWQHYVAEEQHWQRSDLSANEHSSNPKQNLPDFG